MARDAVIAGLETAGVRTFASPCMGICDGLVVAAPVGTRIEIVSGAHKKGTRRRLLAAVTTDRPGKLGRRAVKGAQRRKALNKLARKMDRMLATSASAPSGD